MELIYKSLSDLKPFQKNPNKHPETQLKYLEKSFKEFGYTSPILIGRDNIVLAGHARLKVAERLNLVEIPTIFIDLPYEKAVAYILADNKLARLAEEDRALTGELLLEISEIPDFDIEATGFTLEDMNTYLDLEPNEVVEDDFNPDDEVETRCKVGDLWQLGKHFLLNGDSTKKEDVERLLNGVKIDLLLTDPPYGIEVVGGGGVTKFGKVGGDKPLTFNKDTPPDRYGKIGGCSIVESKTYLKIKGDSTTETAKRVYNITQELGIENAIIWGGNYFTDFLTPSPCWIIWDKENTGDFADAELCWTSFDKGTKLYHWLWNGLSRKGDRASELVSRVHPTQKPVGLHGEILKDFSKEGDNILDLFLGSGTTLIACEQTKRTLYGIEYESSYCDIILSRWEKFTGQTAQRIN